MAEVVLNIKNLPKVMKPTQNDVIVFNGKEWYITTKESLLAEAYEFVENGKKDLAAELQRIRKELEATKLENTNFKKEVAGQLYQMSQLIAQLYKK